MRDIKNCCDNYYLHVAKLFYAMAFIDKTVREEEVEALKEALKQELLPKYKNREEVVTEILKNFDNIKAQQRIAEECFHEFVAYKKENEAFFVSGTNNMLWEVSCRITDSVNKKNKSELILLVRLGKQLGVLK
jgi:hypothetical protein